MKRRRYLFALSCLLVGIMGFGGVYMAESIAIQKQEQIEQQAEAKPKESEEVEPQETVALLPENEMIAPEEIADLDFTEPEQEPEMEPEPEMETVETAASVDVQHFEAEAILWPALGNVILPYSMDGTIYFPTLGQYRYHDAIVIGVAVNEPVSIVADGIIKDVYTNEETGLTVVEELGDGYEAVYGQLKDINFEIGQKAWQGQVLGYVSETTKYYAQEGSNVYFAMRKDGEAINPMTYLE